ncbi:NAD-dependent dihydropyrimidine dehydrogenase subunit PreA-like [Hibiscus syriacus]|uniref:NAD-dependent dihydropyrimidine dehydrogenase subunit PreA-like n=2 Tax=Hibiscus syriacus TaxID=106335 RepID=A0A6A2XZE6_HIBSY|nr:NAD-dependent dihydropyrimidine dehydrogenase subunit PreA-like [Hibiscus syriacus]
MEANKSEYHHQEEEAGDSDDIELLKTRISSHPLYGRLVENHLNCLKVGGICNGGRNSKGTQRQAEHYDSSNNINKDTCSSSMQLNQSELDLFMEGYCSTLSKLKEAMEEPQLESIVFISGMHSLLRDLARPNTLSSDVLLLYSRKLKRRIQSEAPRVSSSNGVDH